MAEIIIEDTDLASLKGKVVVITGMDKINALLDMFSFLT